MTDPRTAIFRLVAYYPMNRYSHKASLARMLVEEVNRASYHGALYRHDSSRGRNNETIAFYQLEVVDRLERFVYVSRALTIRRAQYGIFYMNEIDPAFGRREVGFPGTWEAQSAFARALVDPTPILTEALL